MHTAGMTGDFEARTFVAVLTAMLLLCATSISSAAELTLADLEWMKKEKRTALVIGNGDYPELGHLRNAKKRSRF